MSRFLKHLHTILTSDEEIELINFDFLCKSIQDLKFGKAACLDDEIESEHLVHAHSVVQSMLVTMFNIIFHNGYVPRKFGCEILIPYIKYKSRDETSSDDYRGITLSSNIAKLSDLETSSQL